MIYVTGDTHGTLDLDEVMDFFELEVLVQELSKEDYLIILGDAGICWDGGRKDAWVKERLSSLPVTVLWLDGNHENFDLIAEYPVTNWNGGKVQMIAPDIIHLMRGYVYTIEEKKFWVMGGGFSIDKGFRIENVSWWAAEMPNEEEYTRGTRELEKVGNRVDYILTHTAPRQVAEQLVDKLIPGEEELQYYLQMISEQVEFDEWYFGHWHMDCTVNEKYVAMLKEVVRIV